MIIPSDHSLIIPSEHSLDHSMTIPSDHSLIIPSDHSSIIPSDHSIRSFHQTIRPIILGTFAPWLHPLLPVAAGTCALLNFRRRQWRHLAFARLLCALPQSGCLKLTSGFSWVEKPDGSASRVPLTTCSPVPLGRTP